EGTNSGEQYKLRAVDRLLRFAVPSDQSSELDLDLRRLICKSPESSDWFICSMSGSEGNTRSSFICHPQFNRDSGQSERDQLREASYRYPGTNDYYIVSSKKTVAVAAQAVDVSTASNASLLELESMLDRLSANYVLHAWMVGELLARPKRIVSRSDVAACLAGPSGDFWRSEQRIELAVAAGKPDIRVDGRVVARMTHSVSGDDGEGEFHLAAEARRKTRNAATNETPAINRSASWLSPVLTQEAQVKTIGELLEENENCLRRQLEDVYLQKIKEIVDNLHSLDEAYVPKETATALRDVRPTPGMAPHPLFAGELANVLKSRKKIE
ncbi:hypothetical protein FOZ63_032180, partial [Perkinsus olseni]